MSAPKITSGKRALAWLALSCWLAYSLTALWIMEKDNIKNGKVCTTNQ